jgi:hypothetical protein
MSKHINVNPGQYKVAGREKLGKTVTQSKVPRAQTNESRKQPRAGRTHKTQ